MGAFEQVIQAFHRLMDLKEKYLDIEVCILLFFTFSVYCNIKLTLYIFLQVLGILVESVINGRKDNKNLPGRETVTLYNF